MTDTWVAAGLAVGGPPTTVVATSPDGVTWTGRTTPADGAAGNGGDCVATDGAGTFLVGLQFASGITVMKSVDGGLSWVTAMDASVTDTVWGIVWAPGLGLWVAGMNATTGPVIPTSPDGVTWTSQTTPFDGSIPNEGAVYALGWNGSLLVAGGVDATNTYCVMTSPDGVTWTQQTTPFDGVGIGSYVDALAWSATLSLWIAGASNDNGGAQTAMTSPDGITWTAITTPLDGTFQVANCVAVNDAAPLIAIGMDVAVGGQAVVTSPDGVTWTAQTTPWSNVYAIHWSSADSLWAAGPLIGNVPGTDCIATSPDAITWTTRASPFTGGSQVEGITDGPGATASSAAPLVRVSVDTTIETDPIDTGATGRVVQTVLPSGYLGMPTPKPFQDNGVGNHVYEVIVCDQYGFAYGQIVSAVPTEIDFQLDDIGQALIDFWILDPTASCLAVSDIPGGKEIQIWRDGQLLWWGVPTSYSFDAEQVHLTCSGLLWYFSTRSFGPNPFNYLINPGFETGDLTGWEIGGTVQNCTVEPAGFPNIPLEGDYSCLCSGLILEPGSVPFTADGYLRQFVDFPATGDAPVTWDLSAWVYNIYGVFGDFAFIPPFEGRGLYMAASVSGVLLTDSPQVATLDGTTPSGQWNRMDVQVLIPAGTPAGQLEIRLYAGASNPVWDACVLTTNLAVGMNQNLSPVIPTDLLDVRYIIENILTYAQDPAWGKSGVSIYGQGGRTGTALLRLYNLSDNGGVLDALNEFPTTGVCDLTVGWDITGHFRWLDIAAPAVGKVRYNYPMELGVGAITDLQGGVDGSTIGTAQCVLGQGSSGSSEDVGFAIFPSFLGGKVSTIGAGHVTLGSTTVTVAGGGFFSPDDEGKGIYSLAQALPVGTIIETYVNPGAVVVSTPHSAAPGSGATRTLTNDTIGVGGLVIDVVQSSIQDLPIGSLQKTAQQQLVKAMAGLPMPTAKFKDDVPGSPWSVIGIGDVVPVYFDYGWLQIPGPMMRIVGLTIYPVTDEIAPTFNPVNAIPG